MNAMATTNQFPIVDPLESEKKQIKALRELAAIYGLKQPTWSMIKKQCKQHLPKGYQPVRGVTRHFTNKKQYIEHFTSTKPQQGQDTQEKIKPRSSSPIVVEKCSSTTLRQMVVLKHSDLEHDVNQLSDAALNAIIILYSTNKERCQAVVKKIQEKYAQYSAGSESELPNEELRGTIARTLAATHHTLPDRVITKILKAHPNPNQREACLQAAKDAAKKYRKKKDRADLSRSRTRSNEPSEEDRAKKAKAKAQRKEDKGKHYAPQVSPQEDLQDTLQSLRTEVLSLRDRLTKQEVEHNKLMGINGEIASLMNSDRQRITSLAVNVTTSLARIEMDFEHRNHFEIQQLSHNSRVDRDQTEMLGMMNRMAIHSEHQDESIYNLQQNVTKQQLVINAMRPFVRAAAESAVSVSNNFRGMLQQFSQAANMDIPIPPEVSVPDTIMQPHTQVIDEPLMAQTLGIQPSQAFNQHATDSLIQDITRLRDRTIARQTRQQAIFQPMQTYDTYIADLQAVLRQEDETNPLMAPSELLRLRQQAIAGDLHEVPPFITELDVPEDCPLCYEKMKPGSKYYCGHACKTLKYCVKCLEGILRRMKLPTCPQCRRDIVPAELTVRFLFNLPQNDPLRARYMHPNSQQHSQWITRYLAGESGNAEVHTLALEEEEEESENTHIGGFINTVLVANGANLGFISQEDSSAIPVALAHYVPDRREEEKEERKQ